MTDAPPLGWAVRELLACPVCHANLVWEPEFLECTTCLRQYPIEDGVPDLVAEKLPPAIKLEDDWYSDASAPRLSEGHDAAHSAARSPIAECLRELGCDARSTILSVATGIGVEIPFLRTVSERIVGIDVPPTALRQFRRRWPYLALRAEAGRLPFRDGVFDAVVASGLLHHLVGYTSLGAYLKEFGRVAGVRGAVIALEPNALYPVQWILWPINRFMQWIRPGWRGLVPHERPLSPFFLVRQFRSVGLADADYATTTFTHNRFPRWVTDWLKPCDKRFRGRSPFRSFGWWILVWGRRFGSNL